jgi:cytochrome d ubiquinol oxidase subunit II
LAFSGFYLAMLLTLSALIVRPLGFDYRSKLPIHAWRSSWDMALVFGGFVPALIFGVAFGNLLQGVPFHFDETLRSFYDGSFFGLLNPFAVLCGLVSVSMLLMHGAVFLQYKTEGVIQQRCTKLILIFAIVTLVLFTLAGFWVANIEGYAITSSIAHDAPSNPLNKTVQKHVGAWLVNYYKYPVLFIAPVVAFIAGVSTVFLSKRQHLKTALLSSGLTLAGIIFTAGGSMFPFLMPSSNHPDHSLTVWDASSSQNTLRIMFLVTLVFLPTVLAYTSWVFKVLSGKVTENFIQQHDHTAY